MTLKLFACGDVVNLTSNNNFIDENLKHNYFKQIVNIL